jgi:hypothetical protein
LRPVGAGGAGGPGGGSAPVDDLVEEPVDPDELVNAPDAPAHDSVTRLVADFGAEVIEERPRD